MILSVIVGWGTDEKAVVAVLGYRNASQRRQIRIAYEQLFEEDLVKRFESELSGHLEVLFLFHRSSLIFFIAFLLVTLLILIDRLIFFSSSVSDTSLFVNEIIAILNSDYNRQNHWNFCSLF